VHRQLKTLANTCAPPPPPPDISLYARSDVQQQDILILGPSINNYIGPMVSDGTMVLMTYSECTCKKSNMTYLR
jgi:hypothetical protein